MNSWQLFDLWAPVNSEWSKWAKPVLFAQGEFRSMLPPQPPPVIALDVAPNPGLALIVDLPGGDSVAAGLQLARRGFRPVPLFNGVANFGEVVRTTSIRELLSETAATLTELSLPPAAPPAFLIDSLRDGGGTQPRPGGFDNRWLVFPQDFPSSRYFLGRGIQHVMLIQEAGRTRPMEDLAHVLRRFQEGGLKLSLLYPGGVPAPMEVATPRHYRTLWQRALVLAGLRRNSAGGFGSIVPEPSSSGYSGG